MHKDSEIGLSSARLESWDAGEEREGRPARTNYGRLSGIITVCVSAAVQVSSGCHEPKEDAIAVGTDRSKCVLGGWSLMT